MADPDCTYAVVDMSKKKKNREHVEQNCLDTEATYYNMALYSAVNYDTEDQDLPTTTSIAAEEDYSRLQTYLRNSPTAKEPEPVIVSTTSSDHKSGSKSGHKASECQNQVVRPACCAVAIVLVLAVLAIVVLFVCIAALFVEVNKLKLKQQPQRSDLVFQSMLESTISNIEERLIRQLFEREATFNQSYLMLASKVSMQETNITQLSDFLNQLMDQQISFNNRLEKNVAFQHDSLSNNISQLTQDQRTVESELQSLGHNITEQGSVVRHALESLQDSINRSSEFQSELQDELQMLTYHVQQQSQLQTFSASSCADLPLSFSSGYYWVMASNGSAVRVYCDMTRSCGGVTGGWMRVAELDMTNSSHQCPSGLLVRNPSGENEPRTCVSANTTPSCSNGTFFTIFTNFTKVCGKIIGYQIGGTNGFHSNAMGTGIGSYYMDGVSLTLGSPRQHVWTFAAARDLDGNSRCPVRGGAPASFTRMPPDFVGTDFFCDTGAISSLDVTDGTFYGDRPLWDCENGIVNCDSSGSPPWFYKELSQLTTDSIEMRVCRDEEARYEDVAIKTIEIYVQ